MTDHQRILGKEHPKINTLIMVSIAKSEELLYIHSRIALKVKAATRTLTH